MILKRRFQREIYHLHLSQSPAASHLQFMLSFRPFSQTGLSIYLDQYEVEDESGGCGPQAAEFTAG